MSECCPWYDMCIYKTATCSVRYPDNGCVLYRWFKELISKENKGDCGDCKYTDHKKSEPPCNSCDLTFSNYMDKNKKVKIDFDINDLTKGVKKWE